MIYKKTIGFLFGAGITPNGFPKTKDITEEIQKINECWYRDGTQYWHRDSERAKEYDEIKIKVKELMDYLFKLEERIRRKYGLLKKKKLLP